ncbi:MAG TPA: asparagine synthase (glutamine-hydrolyzing), partial [Vicinamibacterales bacterium]
MCGIAGGLFWDRRFTADGIREIGDRLRCAIAHRGPDGEGVWTTGEHAGPDAAVPLLVHTRLAIIDPTEAGRQPMQAPDVDGCITYNGEVYNFASLRSALEDAGHVFRSRTDTEAILRGYAEWGPAVLDRLRGMFAFAVWAGGRLELARDRFGIKPLYYASGDGWFLFASEVRALLGSGLVEPVLDPDGLWQYLTYQTVPAPRTMIAGVRALEPGSRLTVSAGAVGGPVRYWDLATAAQARHGLPREECLRRTRELLLESVAAHLVSDVPVGAFLSGGIDSSAIVALMREAGQVPRTFSVGFADPRFDESAHAAEVARMVGSDHRTLRLDEPALLDALPAALDAMDQPTGDGVNTYIVSRAVRETGLTVALSGLGGDELFGGYPSFTRLPRVVRAGRCWRAAPRPLRRATGRLIRRLGGDSVTAAKAAAALDSDGSLPALYPLTRQLLSLEQRRRLLEPRWSAEMAASPDPYVPLLSDAFRRMNGAGWISRISYAEARTYMHDVLLRDTDQMSMAHALEVRVPFVDHRVAEFVVGLEDAQKRPGDTPKRLLVEALGAALPASIVRRPKKGFTLPFEPWMRGTLRSFCETRLLGPHGLSNRPFVNPVQVRALWEAFQAGDPSVTWSRVWMLV